MGRVSKPSAGSSKSQAPLVSRKMVDSREVQDLNRLHNSVPSSTQKIPLLSKGNGSIGTKALDRDKHSRKHAFPLGGTIKSVEDTKESSDYGEKEWDLDDLPTFGESFETGMYTRLSPPRLYDAEDDDMLDGLMPTGTQQVAEGTGDGYVDLSSYTSHNEPEAGLDDVWPDEHGLGDENGENRGFPTNQDHARSMPGKGKGKAKALFISNETSSSQPDHGLSATKEDSSMAGGCERDGDRQAHSAINAQNFEVAAAAICDSAFLADAVPADVERPTSSDDLKKWFEAEFGTEHFTYVV
jgi:hypothetical protein